MDQTVNRDTVLTRYKEGPALLDRALAGLPDSVLDARPPRGGWNIRQIVHHIVDGDDLWKACIKAALGIEGGEFTLEWYGAQSQQEWAGSWGYEHRSLAPSIALFKATRSHIVQLVEQVPNAWSRTIKVRTAGSGVETVSVGIIVEMQADHLEHHVHRILAIKHECGGA